MLVILSFNHPQITARCVSSVLNHVNADQVMLFHNGSERQHYETLKTSFPQITHWFVETNSGYTGGVNQALAKAFEKSEWAFLLTNDTELKKWQIDTSALQKGIYSPLVWLRKEGRIDYVGGLFDSSNGRLTHLQNPMSRTELKKGQFLYAPGTAFLIDRETFQKMGPLDETLHTYWEDVDFGARATKQNIHFGFLPDIEIVHQGRKTTGKKAFYTNYLFKRNRRRISWRHCPVHLKPQLLIRLTLQKIRNISSS